MILSHFVWEVTTAHNLIFGIRFLFLQKVCTQIHHRKPIFKYKNYNVLCIVFHFVHCISPSSTGMWKFLEPQGHSGPSSVITPCWWGGTAPRLCPQGAPRRKQGRTLPTASAGCTLIHLLPWMLPQRRHVRCVCLSACFFSLLLSSLSFFPHPAWLEGAG